MNPRSHLDSGRVNQFSSMDRLGPPTPNNGDSPNDVSRARDTPKQRTVVTPESPEVVEETRCSITLL